MRTLLLCSLVLCVAFAWGLSARGDDGTAGATLVGVAQRVEVPSHQMLYLRAREAALTTYVLHNAERADALKRLAAELRAGGFSAQANPSQTRELLLAGLEQIAEGLRKDLPVVTPETSRLLEPQPK